MIQALALYRAKEALAIRIFLWCAVCRAPAVNARCLGDAGKERPVCAVMIGAEMRRVSAARRDLTELLCAPRVGGMTSCCRRSAFSRVSLGLRRTSSAKGPTRSGAAAPRRTPLPRLPIARDPAS